MQNLLEETLQSLFLHGKTPNNVVWVGSADGEYTILWKEFEDLAKDINYREGYGAQRIAFDLVVVGKDWWLERDEYDGSEWWSYCEKPQPNNKTHSFTALCVDQIASKIGWCSLEELNNGNSNTSSIDK